MAKTIHLFKCSCENKTDMTHADFLKHLDEAHNLNAKEVKGKKQMVMHLDGAKFYNSTYKWTLDNGFTFHEYFKSTRSKKDIMYFD